MLMIFELQIIKKYNNSDEINIKDYAQQFFKYL